MKKRFTYSATASAVALLFALPITSVAQEAQTEEEAKSSGVDFERVLVTGSFKRNRTVMQSSVSVSALNEDDIKVTAPRSTAEIFRSLPGVRSESTGGEGNANIAIRGLPVASGGAKFLTLQEDGLPVLQFGDIAFGNADIFLRADATVSRVDVVRGGSASTAASNSPGGVINLISKTGEENGGSVAATVGLDYDTFRTDFEYGGELGKDMRFHVGGFLHQGAGPRDPGYKGNNGGQIKANVTKEFDSGYVRAYFKYLDDRSVSYMPMPMYANGDSVAGYNAKQDTLQSAYLLSTLRLNGENQISRGDIRDGMHPQVSSIGFEAAFDLADGWDVQNRFRFSDVSGRFNTPFPAEIASGNSVAQSIGGDGAQLVYANGPDAGSSFNGTGNVIRMHTFDVEMEDFGSLVNDLRLSKSFEKVDVTVGYYLASQAIRMSWLWNSYVSELKGDNAALLNVVGADGTEYSENGLYAYGVPYWGNCCQRNYDTEYDIAAPYVELSTQLGDVNVDLSVRHDSGDASGFYSGAAQSAVDMNRDGVISVAEQSVSGLDLANPSLVNYDWSYTSYSLGANYQLEKDTALFARLSRGGRANADRLLFGKVRADGTVAKEDAVDMVDQLEAGVKWRRDNLSLFATLFHAKTEEQNFEATSQKFFDRQYKATGLELESSYTADNFDLRGSVTWTDASISKDALSPDLEGNTPRRQADFIYSLIGRYYLGEGQVGLSLVGTTDSYAQDNNDLKFDGYTQVNAFAVYNLSPAMTVSLNVNNLFDTVGLTEAEEGSASASDIIRARTINGRTSSLTVTYKF